MTNARLRDVARIFNGKTPAISEQRSAGHPVLKIRDITEDGTFVGEFNAFVDSNLAGRFDDKWLCLEDTLILNAAHNADYVGSKAYLAQPSVAGCLPTGEWLIVRPDGMKADKRFVHYWLLSERTRQKLKDCVKGIHLYPRDVAELPIFLPPISEQRRIAAILEKADSIRNKRREAPKLADDFTRSMFFDMFGDPATNSKGWPLLTLGQLTEFMTSGSRGWASHYAAEGAKFLRIQNVGKNRLLLDDIAYVDAPDTAEAKRTRVRPGDLLISITADLGRTAVIPVDFGEGYINQHLALLRLREIEPIFASAWLQSAHGQMQFERLNRGGVKAGLNFDDLRSLQVVLPPSDLQKKFVSVTERVECLRSRHRAAERDISELFRALAQIAFNGRQ